MLISRFLNPVSSPSVGQQPVPLPRVRNSKTIINSDNQIVLSDLRREFECKTPRDQMWSGANVNECVERGSMQNP